MEIARAADWSGHEGVSADDPELSRIPRMCKTAIEKDRGEAAEEEGGYTVALLKMIRNNVGIKDDILVGFPGGSTKDQLQDRAYGLVVAERVAERVAEKVAESVAGGGSEAEAADAARRAEPRE
jgi:hypothetical protein